MFYAQLDYIRVDGAPVFMVVMRDWPAPFPRFTMPELQWWLTLLPLSLRRRLVVRYW